MTAVQRYEYSFHVLSSAAHTSHSHKCITYLLTYPEICVFSAHFQQYLERLVVLHITQTQYKMSLILLGGLLN